MSIFCCVETLLVQSFDQAICCLKNTAKKIGCGSLSHALPMQTSLSLSSSPSSSLSSPSSSSTVSASVSASPLSSSLSSPLSSPSSLPSSSPKDVLKIYKDESEIDGRKKNGKDKLIKMMKELLEIFSTICDLSASLYSIISLFPHNFITVFLNKNKIKKSLSRSSFSTSSISSPFLRGKDNDNKLNHQDCVCNHHVDDYDGIENRDEFSPLTEFSIFSSPLQKCLQDAYFTLLSPFWQRIANDEKNTPKIFTIFF